MYFSGNLFTAYRSILEANVSDKWHKRVRSPLGSFLRSQKLLITENKGKSKFVAIIGNEACDVDSMVCALLWSYYLQTSLKDNSLIFIPVFNIRKQELRLRKEACFLFDQISLFFKKLLDLRSDTKGFSFNDLLIKDIKYSQIDTHLFAISSLPIDFQVLCVFFLNLKNNK